MRSLKQILYDQYLTFRYILGKTKQYHEGKKKLRLQILKDLLAWQIREGEFNNLYYAMGLHLIGSRQKEYIGRKSFMIIKDRTERKLKQIAGCEGLDYDVISKDKFYANSIFTANGINCIQNNAVIAGSKLIFPNGRLEELESLLNFSDTFILKNIVLEAGEGVLLCRIINNNIELNGELNDWSAFKSRLEGKIWVVQKNYYSHETLRKVNSSALNTTRIVTILKGNEPEYLCGFQGFATGNQLTDSWSKGSVYVGINFEGSRLKESGLTSTFDKRPGLLAAHPDSGVVFKDYEIPFLKEAVDLCIRAHRIMYFNFIIGWDVAITDSGPLIVEANEKPGMNVAQALNGGLRERIIHSGHRLLEK